MNTLHRDQIETQCCVCSRIKTERGWKRSSLMDTAYVSHAYCPRCYERAVAEFQSELELLHLQPAH